MILFGNALHINQTIDHFDQKVENYLLMQQQDKDMKFEMGLYALPFKQNPYPVEQLFFPI